MGIFSDIQYYILYNQNHIYSHPFAFISWINSETFSTIYDLFKQQHMDILLYYACWKKTITCVFDLELSVFNFLHTSNTWC